jgi:hypothetical protein
MELIITFLKNIYPYIILINFALFIFFLIRNNKTFKEVLKKIDKKTYILLTPILLLNLILILLFSPLLDPNHSNGWEYKLSAKELLLKGNYGSCLPYCITREVPVHPVGYPLVISLITFLFGINSHLIVFLNVIFALLTTLFIFILSMYLFKNKIIALLSALSIAVYREFIIYSGTGELETLSILSILFTVLLFFILIDKKKPDLKNLFWLSLLFTIQIRIENALIIIPISIFLILNKKTRFIFPKDLKIITVISVIIISTILLFIYLYDHQLLILSLTDSSPESLNSIGILRLNMSILFNYTIEFRLYFLLFAIVSLAYFKRFSNKLIFLLIWTVTFLLFYSSWGNTRFFASLIERYSISFIAPISILTGIGLSYVYSLLKKNNKLFILLVILLFTLPIMSHKQFFKAEDDYRPLLELIKKIPEESVLIVPSVTEVRILNFETDRIVYQMTAFKEQTEQRTYLLKTLKCRLLDFAGTCSDFDAKFNLQRVGSYKGIIIYKVT